MVRVVVRLDPGGCIRSLSVTGHAAGGRAGHDLVCASVSAMSKTLGLVLEAQPELEVDGSARRKGEMALSVQNVPTSLRQWMRGVTDFYLEGINDLSEQFPDAIVVEHAPAKV